MEELIELTGPVSIGHWEQKQERPYLVGNL
jgi:hypothetical protein